MRDRDYGWHPTRPLLRAGGRLFEWHPDARVLEDVRESTEADQADMRSPYWGPWSCVWTGDDVPVVVIHADDRAEVARRRAASVLGLAHGVGRYCIIRTYSAGVHVGMVYSRPGPHEVVLREARRCWQWASGTSGGEETRTLHELSRVGPNPGSKISAEIERVVLTEAIEIIPCTPAAEERWRTCGWS